MNNCKEPGSWHTGQCCCNCKWQRPISGHPWNKNIQQLSGKVTDIAGWGCTVGDMPTIIFFETKHGMCEMHTVRRDHGPKTKAD